MTKKSVSPLDTFIGQESAKSVVATSIAEFRKFQTPIPTYMLDWPPGHGKNTFHSVLASTMGVKAPSFTSSDGIKRLGQLLHEYRNVDCLILIDEAHVIRQRKLVEPLLTLLESRRFVHPNSVEGYYPKASFMLATTQGWALPDDIKSRITADLPLDEYSDDDITNIILNRLTEYDVDESVVRELVPISLYEPRTARNISDRIRARIRIEAPVTVEGICNDLALSPDGMTQQDRIVLEFMNGSFRNGPGSASSSDIARTVRTPVQAVSRVMSRLVRLGHVSQDDKYIWNLRQH